MSLLQADDVNWTLDGGRMPLHYAADFGQTDVVEFLISKGANINVRVPTASSPELHRPRTLHILCLPPLIASAYCQTTCYILNESSMAVIHPLSPSQQWSSLTRPHI